MLFISCLFLFFTSSAKVKDICHKKKSGECERCCAIRADKDFQKFLAAECTASKAHSTSLKKRPTLQIYQSHAEKSHINPSAEYFYFYTEYMGQYCDSSSDQPQMQFLEYSECAKGCPKGKTDEATKNK